MKLIRPPAFRQGHRVGVIAPSFPSAVWYPERFAQGIAGLSVALEAEVVVAAHVAVDDGFTSGAPRERADELMGFISDPSIGAVFTSIGGFNSAEILPYLDRETLIRHPTILVGYSDVTSLLLGIQALAGWTTFHGPAVMTEFGEMPSADPFTVSWLKAIISPKEHRLELVDPDNWTDEFLDWGTTAWHRKRKPSGPGARSIWRSGRGRGRLFGGNIETLNFLVGTDYLVAADDIVLVIEATGEEASLPRIRRALTQLHQNGILGRVRAALIGRSPEAVPFRGVNLKDIILNSTEQYGFPIVADLAFGHTSPMWTLPIGLECDVSCDLDAGESHIILDGQAVQVLEESHVVAP